MNKVCLSLLLLGIPDPPTSCLTRRYPTRAMLIPRIHPMLERNNLLPSSLKNIMLHVCHNQMFIRLFVYIKSYQCHPSRYAIRSPRICQATNRYVPRRGRAQSIRMAPLL